MIKEVSEALGVLVGLFAKHFTMGAGFTCGAIVVMQAYGVVL